MSPVYMNPQQSSSIPYLELKGDQQLSLPTIIGYVRDHVTTSNNTYFSGPNLDNHHGTTQFLAMDYSRCTQEKVVEKLILSNGHKPIVYPFDNRDQGAHKIDIVKNDEKPKKFKPSKLRILQKTTAATAKCKKIMGDDKGSRDHHHLATAQPHQQTNIYRVTSRHEANNNMNGIRMCTDCHTTTTPLWRSGPQGPKSLCNACGIRQRKARRAAMAAATAGFPKDTTLTSSIIVEAPKIVVEDITSENKLPLKKRSKTFNTSWNYNDNNYNNNNNNNDNNNNNKNNDDNNDIFVDNNYRSGEKHSFEDFESSSRSKNYSKANSSQRVFPRDEEEGAILLMALSCGLACSS